jgi:hypothetical protein
LPTPPLDGKLACPRCGEPVPAARWPIDTAVAAGEPPIHPRAQPQTPGIRKTAFLILGVMLTMAVVGLSYAIWTTKLRQSRHPWMPEKQAPITFRSPMQLSGLGYLPKGTQIVVGLQIAEWLEDKTGKQLLEEPRPALLDWVLRQITRSTSLKIDEIDHVVLASAFDAQLVLIVTTRQPYSPQKIAAVLQPAQTSVYQQKPLYDYSLKPLGEAMLWCVEERTLLYVLRLDAPKREHLSGLSATPRPMEELLPASLRAVLTERLPKHNLLWAVARLEQLGALNDWLPFVLGKQMKLGPIQEMKAFAIGLEPLDGLTLTGHFQMTDAKAAAKFKAMLAEVKIDGATSQKVETTPADAKEPWLTWQMRGDAAAVRALLDGSKK